MLAKGAALAVLAGALLAGTAAAQDDHHPGRGSVVQAEHEWF
ncbi:hypothetical protein [Kitasatospora cheerisanensis]|uniref:Uncharacterized protein n=1 Tax=Kitasatospora cheerisanensis KCTC 2395 TaxID=1348663 RepID=A0A066ZCT8_9ACTN|nr:hypothetical protein [Kitasatospora cheerisanensis]KDN88121.1 hypothetical protein KCH_01980 [Kitasatospora cheerisanensis KCTC 2395]